MKLFKRLKEICHFRLLRPIAGRKRQKWMLAASLCAIVLLMPSAFHSSAATVSVDINGSSLYQSKDLLKSGVTYVPLRAFVDYIGEFQISWNGTSRTATIRDTHLTITARVGDRYIASNGIKIHSSVANLLINNRIYVPIRSICEAMGLDVAWNAGRRLVTVSGSYQNDSNAPPITDGEINGEINSEDLYWLSRIISAESRGEPMAGKIAVGTVVMNRVKSSQYPNTIYDVIFDKKFGTQFTPAATGTIHNAPTAESVEAARRVLAGERTDSRIIFFVNEKLAPDNWISKNRPYILTIGNHKFYA